MNNSKSNSTIYKSFLSLNYLKKKWIHIAVFVIIITYIIITSIRRGNDINVYLYASKQLFNQDNIYTSNPFNKYLYSPLFALLIRPLSLLKFEIARVLWALINLIVTFRLWYLIKKYFISQLKLNRKLTNWWTGGLIIISLGFLNHNLILGQITIIILWLTIEGLFKIMNKQTIKGSALLALGINIKIIPMLALYYLFFKKRFKAALICVAFVVVSLFLPSLIIGLDYNTELLKSWKETINPTEKYELENNVGCSLNLIIPAFMYDFKGPEDNVLYGINRKIASLSYLKNVYILQISRILLVLSVIFLVYLHKNKRTKKELWYFWEISYLMLISLLIFPHQMKYAMVYFLPAGSYMILFIVFIFKQKWKVELKYRIIGLLSIIMLFLISIAGKDIIGKYLLQLFDFFYVFGITTFLFLIFLMIVKPTDLDRLTNL